MSKKCCVIGGGLGGLAAAVEVARLGIDVDLYEQNWNTGGKANTLTFNNFRFDTGPSLLTMPFVLESIFTDAGKNLKNYLTIKPLEKHCIYFYPDGTIITAYNDIEKFADEIELKTKDSRKHFFAYLKYCKNIYDLTADFFLFNDFRDFQSIKRFLSIKTILNIHKLDSLRSMHRANRSFFRSEKTIQLFDRYATYNGSNPYKAPATLNIISHVENNIGSFIAEEGIYGITEALTKLAKESGVRIYYNHKVQRILRRNREISGVTVNGENITYDYIVSNADASSTYKELLNDQSTKAARKYKSLEPSSSALVFYWGMNNATNNVGIHNILFSKDYKKEFNEIFSEKICPGDPTVYIYISSKYKKNDAPSKKENWYVMINAPYEENQDWEYEIDKSRSAIIQKISKTLKISVQSKIICEKTLTPRDIRRMTSGIKGSLYGISSNTRKAAFLRQGNKSEYYKGLFFCGGSVHPGGGIPLVLLSGKLAARAIEKEVNKNK